MVSSASLTSILIATLSLIPPAWSCRSMKAGDCQILVEGLARESGYSNWKALTIYNDACGVIGSVSNPQQGMSITSQLPYTLELRRLSTMYWRKGGMRYDYAKEKLKGFPDCEFVEDEAAGDAMDHADGLPAVKGWNRCYSDFRCA